MPAHFSPYLQGNPYAPPQDGQNDNDVISPPPSPPPRVHLSVGDGEAIADIQNQLTAQDTKESRPVYPEPHSSFDKFLEAEVQAGKKRSNLGVSFKSLTTWGGGESQVNVKTLATAFWRTLTLQDIYEWTVKPWVGDKEPEHGRALIRDFSGVVRSGEMML